MKLVKTFFFPFWKNPVTLLLECICQIWSNSTYHEGGHVFQTQHGILTLPSAPSYTYPDTIWKINYHSLKGFLHFHSRKTNQLLFQLTRDTFQLLTLRPVLLWQKQSWSYSNLRWETTCLYLETPTQRITGYRGKKLKACSNRLWKRKN